MSVVNDPALAKQFRQSMVNIKIGGRVLAAKHSPRCKVCTHPARAMIEERLLLNDGYTAVARWTEQQESADVAGIQVPWPTLTAHQLTRHYDAGHCPVDTQVLHELSEQVMAERGVSYETMASRLVEPVVFAKLIMTRAQERLAKGEISPTVREGLAASKLVHDIQLDASQDEIERLQAYIDAMGVYFATVQEIVTPDQWQAIGASLATNPVLREIAAKLDAVEAEVVE